MSKETFLDMAKSLGLSGNEERLNALYEDVKTAFQRIAPLYGIETTGVPPSPINPWFDQLSTIDAGSDNGGAA